MEVHHHAHTVPIATGRKKFTHYLWEFLMLFLAVFCGFLAENQREHYVEAERAEDYARSFYNDLKSDTADINKGQKYVRYLISALDSFSSIAGSGYGKTLVPGTFYFYCRDVTHTYPIDWSRSTLNQLIQSGNLRYIKNKELVNKINQYYALQGTIDATSRNDDDHREVIRGLRNKILDDRFFSLFLRNVNADDVINNVPLSPQIDSILRLQLPLQKGAEQYLPELRNHLAERRMRLEIYLTINFSKAQKLALEIMSLLKKEYHLK